MTVFSSKIEKDLRRVIRGECTFNMDSLEEYSGDACWYKIRPVCVAHPKHTEDVQSLLHYCNKNDIPVIPRGAGTGLAGQAVGMGVVIDFTRHMNRIREVSDDAVTVQPGIILSKLNETLKSRNKFFPIDPASSSLCTIGGMIGTNAAGAHGLRYGATKDHVKTISVVLSNGDCVNVTDLSVGHDQTHSLFYNGIVETLTPLLEKSRGVIARGFPSVAKNSSGYNLKDAVAQPHIDFRKIIVGSEGTLALAVEATLHVKPLPPHRLGALAYLDTYDKTVDATLLGLEHGPAAIEILDQTYVSLVKGMNAEIDRLILDEAQAMLYFEFEGDSESDLSQSIMKLNRSLASCSPIRFLPLLTAEELQAVWSLREEASKTINFVKSKGKTSFIEDVTVPVHRLSAYLSGLRRILARHGIEFSAYGHAGAGNIHCAAFVDLNNTDHYKSIDIVASEVYDLAISLGGTLSGEHGDGFVRTPFLERLYGRDIYELFKEVKHAFDPQGILNPGKIVGPQNESILHDINFQ